MAVPRQEKCDLIGLQFPNAKGALLHKCVWKHFVQSKSFSCHYLTSSKARAISCHPLNDRDTDEQVEKLAQSFLTEGVYSGVSSKPVVQRTSPGAETWYAIGAGNRQDAFYVAKVRGPDNQFLIEAEKTGMEDAVQLTDDAPADVIALLVNDFNNFHGGAANTYPFKQQSNNNTEERVCHLTQTR